MARDSEYASMKKTKDDQHYLIQCLDQELHTSTVDWNSTFTILLLMGGGMDADSRITELVRLLFKIPRAMKMNDFHAQSYYQSLFVLRNMGTPEAALVLYDALTRPFWGTDPVHSRKMVSRRETEENVDNLRRIALDILTEYPPETANPLLEEFTETFPPPSEGDLSMEAVFRRDVLERFTRLRTKQGRDKK